MPALKTMKTKRDAPPDRLIGVSYHMAGVDWSPSQEERVRVRELLDYFANRRGLYRPYNSEITQFIVPMATEIRDRLADEFEERRRDTPYRESLMAMHAACNKLLERTHGTDRQEYRLELYYAGCLGELRSIIGLHIARLASSYDVEVPGELMNILPNEPQIQPPSPVAVPKRPVSKVGPRIRRKRRIRSRSKSARQR